MFSISLELPELQVIKQEKHTSDYLIHVEKKIKKERCPHCGFETASIHDKRTRKVRDLPVLNHRIYLCIHMDRFRCQNCREVFSAQLQAVSTYNHFTNRFLLFIYEQVLGTTVQEVSRKQRIAYSTVERIFYAMAAEQVAINQSRIEDIQEKQEMTLSLDEISVRKGHKYETVLYDAESGVVMGLNEHRDYEATYQLLSEKIIRPDHVKNVVIDMWNPFHKAVSAIFPDAKIIIDKYHVVQKVTQALDQVRKKTKGLKRSRFILLKGCEKLKQKEKEKLNELFEKHEDLAYAYYLKELFRDFYAETDREVAEKQLEQWVEIAKKCPYLSFVKVAKTIEKWKSKILQYFQTPYTNGRAEGTNNKIKNIKRRAYGYRNLARFRMRVCLECTGKRVVHKQCA